MPTFFDPAQAKLQPNGGYLAPRADLLPSEKCFVALDGEKRLAGFLQTFAGGAACYWKTPGDPAKPARSLEEAFEEIFSMRVTCRVLACPKCKSQEPGSLFTREDLPGQPTQCRTCGSTVSI